MFINPASAYACASALDGSDAEIAEAIKKVKASEDEDLADLEATMAAARTRALGVLGTARTVQQELSAAVRTCVRNIVALDSGHPEVMRDSPIPFPTLN